MAQARAQLASAVTSRMLSRPKAPTILVAEDSADSLEMMRTLLRRKGYEVLTAEDGPEAVHVAFATIPDLILVDLRLPLLDGFDVTRTLRRHPRLRHVPIVILSGHDPAQYRQQALDAGCDDYLLKPIDFDRLESILNTTVPIPSQGII
ncbi:MAG TPA: response regulator [Pyrinomonadaceae bacterium]|nr:response regulator [Pyrinomonadaceae bacterium]